MAQYMRYRGRAVEIYGWMTKGQRVPLLYLGDQGETVGDMAVIDGNTVLWDGRSWVPAPEAGKIAEAN
jgi:hypothetical protein